MERSPYTGALRATAPPRFAFDVLERVGIVDSYEVAELDPVGTVYVAASERGVSCVDTAVSADDFEASFRGRFGRPVRRGRVPGGALRALEAGLTTGFEVDLRGVGDFRAAALTVTRGIPRGEVRSYTWVAREIGRESAVRAVGTAMATNPIPLLIPCHRVVRGDGHIGAYGLGGPEMKTRLLRREGLDPAELERLATRGIRLLASDATGTACLPACHQARAIAPGHRRELHSVAQAAALGFRPCPRCRPF